MRGVILHGPGDVRVEERAESAIEKPTDAVIGLAATCICGSDLWAYRGVDTWDEPVPFGHEYAGIIEEVGSEVRNLRPGQSSLPSGPDAAAGGCNPRACWGVDGVLVEGQQWLL